MNIGAIGESKLQISNHNSPLLKSPKEKTQQLNGKIQTEQTDIISNLPSDIQNLITRYLELSNLSHMKLVSKSWRTLVIPEIRLEKMASRIQCLLGVKHPRAEQLENHIQKLIDKVYKLANSMNEIPGFEGNSSFPDSILLSFSSTKTEDIEKLAQWYNTVYNNRDAFIIWQILAQNIGEEKPLYSGDMEEIENCLPKIKEWCEKHQDRIDALGSLDLSNLGLNSLPESIVPFLKELVELSLAHNNLTHLPRNINQLKSLSWLNLGENNLNGLTPNIGKLSHLEGLLLNDNQFKSLPKEITRMSKLSILILNNNRINTLPKCINQIKNLKVLSLRNNNLSSLPRQMAQMLTLASLDLAENQFSSLNVIYKLTSLESLNLSGNTFNHLSSKIGQLLNLKALVINNNNLIKLPDTLWGLSSLEILGLFNNKLTRVSSKINQLKSLKGLNLLENPLTSLPKGIRLLPNIEKLYLPTIDLEF
jgi:leucine-rich repeat protein SHOC2